MKNTMLKIVTGLVFLVLFNVLFFVLKGSASGASIWGSYAFIHIAYLLFLATPLLFNSKGGYKIHKEGLYARAMSYFLVELVVGVIFIIINPEHAAWALVPQGILLALFLVMQLGGVMASDAAKQTMQQTKKEALRITMLSERVREVIIGLDDPDLKKEVTRSYEALKSSSVESFPEMQDVENSLIDSVDQLCQVAGQNDKEQIRAAAARVLSSVRNRNAALRIYGQ